MDVLALLLQAEKEYYDALKTAAIEAEIYSEGCREKQRLYKEVLKEEWERFEEAENERLQNALFEAEQRLGQETEEKKELLKTCQKNKADLISERLKKEVLQSYGNIRNGKIEADLSGGGS